MWPYPAVLAHRGGGILAPENTIAAMHCGLQHGFHAVEFDVMLSADGVPVVLHDARLGRTVRGAGKVSDHAASALMQMDAGAWFSAAYAGETVPSYEQVFQFCCDHRIWMNVEIKPAPGFDQVTGETVATVTQQQLSMDAALSQQKTGWLPPLLSSFSYAALLAAKKAAPALSRAYLVDAAPVNWQQLLVELDAIALHINHRHLSKALAAAVRQAGYGLFCYTVNDVARARELLSWGVDAFCTDRIDLIGPDFC